MTAGLRKLKAEVADCLGQDKSAGEAVECISAHFPDVEVYREQDDLVIKGGARYLIARRVGPDRFRVAENVWAPTTNLVDFGGGAERTLDELIDEISTLAL